MKEKSFLSDPCEHAAIRVQYWFGKDKVNLLPCTETPPKLQDFNKKHKCKHVKTPRIPSQVKHLPLHGYLLTKKKKPKNRSVIKEHPSKALGISVDRSYCNINQKGLAPLALSSRVGPCQLKEHFIVSRKLKKLSKQTSTGPKRHQVVPIKTSAERQILEDPYFQEWTKRSEERHFNIGRIIKYLVD